MHPWNQSQILEPKKSMEKSKSIFFFNCANSSNGNDGNDDSFTGIALGIEFLFLEARHMNLIDMSLAQER